MELEDTEEGYGIAHTFLRCKWSADKIPNFREHFGENEITELKQKLESLRDEISQESMDTCCGTLGEVFVEAAKEIGVCKLVSTGNVAKKSRSDVFKPGFDEKCNNKCIEYMHIKNRSTKDRSIGAIKELENEAKIYKKMVGVKSRDYYTNVSSNLRKLKTNILRSIGTF